MEANFEDAKVTLLTTAQVAQLLGTERTRIKQLDRENQLVVVRRDGKSYVPEMLLTALPDDVVEGALTVDGEETGKPPATHEPLWNLPGTVTLLRDAQFDNEEIISWLWRWNDELEAAPIDALLAGGHHAVNRIAGAAGF